MTLLNSLNIDTSTLTSITSDSRLVIPGALFLAYPGVKNDGRHYIPQAIQAGAAIIIWEMMALPGMKAGR